ncbi:AMP-binding protein [Pseudobacteriovorax antillogorgiicola]|uniref:Acyl-CoA synthetase (AMP-forming)/AMP-acid ligase II n=1 Tax=Pseudobacteriovorax antillogorgiicola TaxID=1513793 RepID=A0A1Y6BGH6_9BACT|nr:AMP-binding protein [Pseudobacteriovorax antillogorgiicola]TCS57497.1 acyl-CoA synthetase (AMP-forming)/AMP-acid ligase II [Pseudobacteriovorax antillogorgiicola]SMF00381.1 Acyl-CoA synthetase (AMP-forming)/AMP-acid ligase II [Pseudobacteriovorax antillogorgiicola]
MNRQFIENFRSRLKERSEPTIQWIAGGEENVLSASALWNVSLRRRHDWRSQGVPAGALIACTGSSHERIIDFFAALNGGFALAFTENLDPEGLASLHRLSKRQIWINSNGQLQGTTHSEVSLDSASIERIWLQTSGTSGTKKWVGYNDHGILHQLQSHEGFFSEQRGALRLSLLPNTHAFGLILDQLLGLWIGQSLFLLAHKSLGIRNLYQFMSIGQEFVSAMVPRQLEIFLHSLEAQQQRFDITIHTGGAPLRESLLAKASELGVRIIEGYGLTELGPGVTMLGEPVGCKVRVDSTDRGDIGEILVCSPSLGTMDPSQQRFKEGYLATGDLGKWLTNGKLKVVGRKGNLIKNSHGKWITLASLEERIITRFKLRECAIFRKSNGCFQASVLKKDPNDIMKVNMLRKHLEQSLSSQVSIHIHQSLDELFVESQLKKAKSIRDALQAWVMKEF